MGDRIRVGIIGCDTSHVTAFTKLMHDESDPDHVPGCQVVAAYPSYSPDIQSSATRVEGFTNELKEKFGVKICESIRQVLDEADAILLESVDGRRHLPELKQIIDAGKPIFIDKPFAASLADAKEMVRLLKEKNVPAWSSSSLRYERNLERALSDSDLGQVHGADTHGPATLEPTNPGLYWYGIHAVEMLYRILGPGCRTVWCISNDAYDIAVGHWSDGRVGMVRGIRAGKAEFGAVIYADSGTRLIQRDTSAALYAPLVRRIVEFFRTKQPPVPLEETLEIMAFIEAALASSRANGRAVEVDASI